MKRLIVSNRWLTRGARLPIAATCAMGMLVACGDESPPTTLPGDAAAGDAGCAPDVTGWSPSWKPPAVVRRACTDAQIDTQFDLCESAASDTAAECAAFNRDPANARCRECLYATEDESTYGPLVYLRNRVLRINIAGCLALADGDLGVAGCGARMQAYQACSDAACMQSCATFEDFQRCAQAAQNTVCAQYRDESACIDPATYAPCLDHATYEQFYRAMAQLFCGVGFPGSDADGGDGGDGAGDAGSARDGGGADGGGVDVTEGGRSDGERVLYRMHETLHLTRAPGEDRATRAVPSMRPARR